MITFEDLGVPLTLQMGVMADDKSVFADSNAYSIKIVKMAYTVGNATLAPTLGDLIVAHDYVWHGVVLSTETTTGAWATANATGFINLYNQHGTIANADVFNNILVSNSTVIAAAGNASGIGSATPSMQSFTHPSGLTIHNGMEAKAALISIETQSARMTFDGSPPTPATLTNALVSRGVAIAKDTFITVRGTTAVKNIKLCNLAAGSNAVYRIVYYF